MSSERSSTATNPPKRLVTPDSSTATLRPPLCPVSPASGGRSLVLLSSNPLPPVTLISIRASALGRSPPTGDLCHRTALGLVPRDFLPMALLHPASSSRRDSTL